MPRELNPELFGQRTAPVPPAPTMTTPPPPMAQPDNTRRQIRDLENQIQVLTQRLEQVTASYEQRLSHLNQSQKVFETQIKEMFNDAFKNQAQITSKITERRVADVKIQEMMDRHNSLVQSFEIRMGQMHKLTQEQEMKLMTYQAVIDEILREIRGLKR